MARKCWYLQISIHIFTYDLLKGAHAKYIFTDGSLKGQNAKYPKETNAKIYFRIWTLKWSTCKNTPSIFFLSYLFLFSPLQFFLPSPLSSFLSWYFSPLLSSSKSAWAVAGGDANEEAGHRVRRRAEGEQLRNLCDDGRWGALAVGEGAIRGGG